MSEEISMQVGLSLDIPNGKHYGEIVGVYLRAAPYNYVDVVVKEDDTEAEIKYSCPKPEKLNNSNRLGRLIERFTPLEQGKTVKIKELLIGKRVEFYTNKKETDKGTFFDIQADTLKPKE